jgi:beta-lactam-binding protein with PASTA domain
MVNTTDNYLGRNVDEVRMDVQTLLSTQTPGSYNITLKDPLMYIYSDEPAGTVMQQRPEPGSTISGNTVLELVVSMGPENTRTRLPNLVGLGLEDALEQIGRAGIDFEFSLRPAESGERPGTVVSQNPPGDTLAASSTRVNIVMASPEILSENLVFGLFTYDMAKNPYPLLVNLESLLPGGTRQRLLTVLYPGGRLSVPYLQPPGAELVLSMLNREIHRQTVTLPVDSLGWF